jgi:hypothetical protein
MELSEEELVIIRNALQAYMIHLHPTATYVKEIADWRTKVVTVQDKVCKIILHSKNV